MIKYTTLGTNNLERAAKYYDALLSELGAKRAFESDRLVAYGTGRDKPMLWVIEPHDKNEATVGNGVMVALDAENREIVDKVYAKAMELGSPSEGEPGERAPTFYGAYFRDPDGNKICICRFG
jgi:catechol 2,3-dioxygenase-like lactoylglutathione lyase family enzyme